MTPLKLSILLWRAAHPTASYVGAPTASYVGARTAGRNADDRGHYAALSQLNNDGLIKVTLRGSDLTDKGNVFVAHLLKQPLPVPVPTQWEMPAE